MTRSNSDADFESFRPLSPAEARFRQNVWETRTQNRVPKYGWLSRVCHRITYRWFFGIPEKELRFRDWLFNHHNSDLNSCSRSHAQGWEVLQSKSEAPANR
jgi:hypothetical protein